MGRRPTTGYANEEIPGHMPPANQGAIPVLVRLVDYRTSWPGSGPKTCTGVLPPEDVKRR